jgi:hypothetical protein
MLTRGQIERMCDLLMDRDECHTPGCSLYMNRAPDIPILAATEYPERHAAESEERERR